MNGMGFIIPARVGSFCSDQLLRDPKVLCIFFPNSGGVCQNPDEVENLLRKSSPARCLMTSRREKEGISRPSNSASLNSSNLKRE